MIRNKLRARLRSTARTGRRIFREAVRGVDLPPRATSAPAPAPSPAPLPAPATSGYYWSARSQAQIDTCVDPLRVLFEAALVDPRCPRNLRADKGHRTHAEQAALYAIGRTEPGRIITWARPGQSLHNTTPSRALDVFVLVGGKVTWEWPHYHAVAAFIKLKWSELLAEGKVQGRLKWGGDFRKSPDGPHWEWHPE